VTGGFLGIPALLTVHREIICPPESARAEASSRPDGAISPSSYADRLSPSMPPVAGALSACSFSFQPGIKSLPPSYTSRTIASIAAPPSTSSS
jgi:hypothetical protein